MTRRNGSWRLAAMPGVALLAFAALGGPAAAQLSAAQQSALKQNCRSDFMSKCSGVRPGGKDALVCLQKNVESLSPGCKTAVSATLPPPAPAAAAKPAQAAPAPAPAPAAAAAAPPPAPPPPAAAPKTAAPVVSAPPPKAKVAAPPRAKPAAAAVAAPAPIAQTATTAPSAPTAAQQSAMKASCRNDFMAKCKGVSPGGKDALACLQKNVGTLSPSCKQVVSSTMAPAAATAAAPAVVTPAAVTPAAPEPRKPKAPLANAVVMLRACKLDLLRHCRGVEPGGGRELACLAAHEDNLTIRCKMARKVTAPLR